MESRGVVLLLLAVCSFAGAQETRLQAIECPFPEGQGVVSESDCGRYTYCEWTVDHCHEVNNAKGGYLVQGPPQATPRGFTVNLAKADDTVTMFGGDVKNLIFEVINHEYYHVQIKIYDADAARYEVPLPLSLPETPDTDPAYTVGVSEVGMPFHFNVTRNSNGNSLFHSIGPLAFSDQFIEIHNSLASTYLYGLGESTHVSFRHGFEPRSTFPIFARDQPVGTEPMNEYGHHPYYMVMEDDQGNSHSVLLYNSNAMEYSSYLLDDGTPSLTLRTIGGILDFHIFTGPYPEDVNQQYAGMVGLPVNPTYWSLGFQLSRWGYNSTDKVREARERMKAMGIPQDVQTFDIDYMEGQRDFTYDPTNWGDMPALIQELHNDNIKVTTILDPALVIDFQTYDPSIRGKAADVFIKWSNSSLVPPDQEPETGDYVVGWVWPPDTKTVFPDFLKPETSAWWSNEIKLFHDIIDFDALWIDMNEPANFGTDLDRPFNWPPGVPDWSLKCPDNKWDSPPYPTMATRIGPNESKRLSDHSICLSSSQTDGTNVYMHYDVHSLYGISETIATYNALLDLFPEKRPMVLSRSTFPGSGQYAVHWLGDNTADWTHMKMSIVGMFEFNMFGIPMVGADVCGFFDEPDMEMCARWMELGAFYPFSRNHNTNGMADQDPGMWPEVGEISRDTLYIRYRYIPYLYTLFHKAHMHGSTVVRPLLNVYPTDLTARDVDDQFMWGDGLMVAPVITQGAVQRDVYFPEGLWYGLVYGDLAATGPTTLTVSAPLETIPLYIPGGKILPFQEAALNTVESRLNPLGLTIALDSSQNATGDIFWDEGDGEHAMSESYMNNFSYSQGLLTSQIMHGEEAVAGLYWETLKVYGHPTNPATITVNGEALDSSAWSYNAGSSALTVSMRAPLSEALNVLIE